VGGREHVEHRTDVLAAAPYAALGGGDQVRLLESLARVVSITDAGAPVPFPNPMGLPRT
jgi:hypothetical protein